MGRFHRKNVKKIVRSRQDNPTHRETRVDPSLIGPTHPRICHLKGTVALKEAQFAAGFRLGLPVNRHCIVGSGLAIPAFKKVQPVARCAQVGRKALSVGIEEQIQLVRVAVAAAVGAIFEQQIALFVRAQSRGVGAQNRIAGGREQCAGRGFACSARQFGAPKEQGIQAVPICLLIGPL